MNWTDFYLVCFLVGFAMSLLSFVFGALDIHIPGLDSGGPDVPHHGVSPFNLATVMAFVAWFGGAGYLATRFTSLVSAAVLGVAVGAGLVGGGMVFLVLAKVLMRTDATLHAGDYQVVGSLGVVNVAIREGGTGELIFTLGGTRQTAGARSEDGKSIARGTEVVITRYERGIAYVRPWEEEMGLDQASDSGARSNSAG